MSLAAPAIPWNRRWLLPASVACVAVSAIASSNGAEPDAWLATFAAVIIAFLAARQAVLAARCVLWGVAVVVASIGAEGGHRISNAFGSVGAFACLATAVVVLVGMPGQGGMVTPKRRSFLPWLALLGVFWGAAFLAFAAPERRPLLSLTSYERTWAWVAAGLGAATLVAQAEWVARERSLDLGVAARSSAIRFVLGTLFVGVASIALFGPLRPDAVVRLGLALASASVVACAIHPDAARVARVGRRVLALAITGGAVVFLGAAAVAGRGDSWVVMLVAITVALGVGSAASRIEGPIRPEGGVWLDAFDRAFEEAARAEPDDAIREALLALRGPLGLELPSPELWAFPLARLTTVDAAGYLHEREAELPPDLIAVAGGEPQATLRVNALEALEVRRPDLRSLRSWMATRGALTATLIAADGETEGVLVLPAGRRAEPVTLEEVLALKRLADRLATACRARAVSLRMLTRVREANLRADAAEEVALRLRDERAVEVGRHALAAGRLARPATVGIYAAASRMALDALERQTAIGAPIVVVAPSGVDPVPYLARAHLSGARGKAPFVLVDATSVREHDVARWMTPTLSPLALADGGMLVLLDGPAFPAEVQELIAQALASRRVPWERTRELDVQLALTAVAAPQQLLNDVRLDTRLAALLGEAYEAPLVLPRLQDRPEDFRAILTDRLAREGLRVLGRPVGIETAAYVLLAEYDFPGDDVELTAMVQRLVTECAGDIIRVEDVLRLGLTGEGGGADLRGSRKKDPMSA